MKKIISAAAALAACAMFTVPAGAEEKAEVYVTISDGQNPALTSYPVTVTVTDFNHDGLLTITDALYYAHEQYFEGGAEEGFAVIGTEYGNSLVKLWGVRDDNFGFGYYLNDAAAFSMDDPVKDGDYLNAFVYTDKENFSDMYCFFDKKEVTLKGEGTAILTLSGASYDENWNPITVPVSGAEITVNGQPTGVLTDESGRAEITVPEDALQISAVSETQTLVPPYCRVLREVSAPAPSADNPTTGVSLCTVPLGALAAAVLLRKKRNG